MQTLTSKIVYCSLSFLGMIAIISWLAQAVAEQIQVLPMSVTMMLIISVIHALVLFISLWFGWALIFIKELIL